jgi:hypothetical protein
VIAMGVIELNLQTRSSRPSSTLALQWFRIAKKRSDGWPGAGLSFSRELASMPKTCLSKKGGV